MGVGLTDTNRQQFKAGGRMSTTGNAQFTYEAGRKAIPLAGRAALNAILFIKDMFTYD
jgi:hypothetical protein